MPAGLNLKDYFQDDLRRLRAALLVLVAVGADAVQMDCFHRDEAERLKAALTPEERRHVIFTWVAPKTKR